MEKANQITITLEPWQTRQLENFLPSQKVRELDPSNIREIWVNLGKGGCLASYKVINKISEGFEIYLTDAQIARIKKELGPAAEVESVTISAEAIRNEAVGFIHAIEIILEPWQTRQLNNYLPSLKIKELDPVNIRRIWVSLGKGGCLASYKVIDKIIEGFEIYLTDPQIARVQKELGPAAEVLSVTISPEAIQNEAVGFMH
jgi:hypothetical protein